MRLVDYRCRFCGRAKLDFIQPDGMPDPACCGQTMSKLPVAPGLSNVKKMGKMGYGREMTVKEIDDSLAKNGSWVASENERRQIKQMAQDPIEPEIIKAPPNDALIRKKIEAATRKLKERGEI